MNHLTAYQNSLWLADGERFQRYIMAALRRPCPTGQQIRERHRELLQLAKELPVQAVQGAGQTDPAEIRLDAPTKAIRAAKGKVGVIPIYGPVDQRMTGELDKAGGTPLDFVSAALDALLDNPGIGAVVLRFDSPGGNVSGVQELADKIYAARGAKPIYAIADSLAASAAFWLASSAWMLISTPAGGAATVGSVGVYVMHVDESQAAEQDGVKVTTVFAGKNKTEFSPFAPLSDDAKAEAQARVDDIYGQFTSALARNRGTSVANVKDNYGQGRVLTAQAALNAGMIDRVMTFEQLMDKLTGGGASAPAGQQSSAMAMMKVAADRRRRLDN